MIEGRSGGSGLGTRRESWAPPDSGSAHRRIAGLYRVPNARPEPFPAPPSHFLPSAASSPSHLPAGHREKFRRTQAHVQLTRLRRMAWPKGKMIEGRSGGLGAGTSRKMLGPPDSGSAHRRIAGLYRVPASPPLVSQINHVFKSQ